MRIKLCAVLSVLAMIASACWDEDKPTTQVYSGPSVAELLTQSIIYEPMLNEIEAYWDAQYASVGLAIGSDAERSFLYDGDSIYCGTTLYGYESGSPAYCDVNDTIIVPMSWTSWLMNEGLVLFDEAGNSATFNGAGQAGIFMILAHEWGHNIEYEQLGTNNYLQLFQSSLISLELNADCLAGVAIAGVDRYFDEAEVGQILDTVVTLGLVGNPSTHGTYDQRVQATAMGLNVPYGSNEGANLCFNTYIPA